VSRRWDWSTLNPLRVGADGLPFEAALLARLVIVALLVKGYDALPGPGVAFIAALQVEVPPNGSVIWPRLAFYLGAAAVLFNVAPRTGALLAALSLFLVSLWNMGSLSHSRLFPGCLLLLVSLAPTSSATTLFRWQVVLLYAGAALNKSLDLDWWNGQFIHAYSASKAHLFFYADFADVAGRWPARLLSWSAMVLEAAVAVAFARARWVPEGIVCGLALHIGIMAWLGFDFEAFFYTVAAAYAAAVTWPGRIEVLPPSGRVGSWIVGAMARIEWCGIWHMQQGVAMSSDRSAEGRALCVSAYHVDRCDRRTGAAAWRYLWLHHPTLLVAATAVVAYPSSYTPLGWARVALLTAGLVAVGVPAMLDSRRSRNAGEGAARTEPGAG
jgi:hypothetical protein